MTPTDYERAVLQRFLTYWPPPQFVVKHNIRLLGSKTQTRRQIDISVFEAGKSEPFLIAEAKRHKRRIDAGQAGSTIALVQDVGRLPAVMVSISGFSVAAERHLVSEGIEHLTITLKEAQGLRWVPFVEEKFAVDREFREVSGHLVEALRNGDAGAFLDTNLPYEEWLAVVACSQSLFPDRSSQILKTLAREHVDDGTRFNAIIVLDDAGQLDVAEIRELLRSERDSDTQELLRELLNQQA